MQNYLDRLDPIENRSDKELEDDFYEASLKMEPRNCKQLPKFVSTIQQLALHSLGLPSTILRACCITGLKSEEILVFSMLLWTLPRFNPIYKNE